MRIEGAELKFCLCLWLMLFPWWSETPQIVVLWVEGFRKLKWRGSMGQWIVNCLFFLLLKSNTTPFNQWNCSISVQWSMQWGLKKRLTITTLRVNFHSSIRKKKLKEFILKNHGSISLSLSSYFLTLLLSKIPWIIPSSSLSMARPSRYWKKIWS